MKKLFLLLVTFFSLSSYGQNVTFEKFTNEPIRGLEIAGAWEITLEQGTNTGVTISIPEKYKESYTFTLEDNIVKVNLKSRNRDNNNNIKKDDFRITIVCRTLESLYLEGANSVLLNSDFKVGDLKIHAEGVCTILGKSTINSRSSKLNLEGVSNISQLTLHASESVRLQTEGMSNCTLDLISKSVDVVSEGVSKIDLSGSCTYLSVYAEGMVKYNSLSLSCDDCTVNAEGMANVEVKADRTLNIIREGMAKVSYKGGANVRTNMNNVRRLD